MAYDAFAIDADAIYNYSELRGLTRAAKGRHGNWKGVDRVNADLKGLKGVSLLVHDDKLFMRH